MSSWFVSGQTPLSRARHRHSVNLVHKPNGSNSGISSPNMSRKRVVAFGDPSKGHSKRQRQSPSRIEASDAQSSDTVLPHEGQVSSPDLTGGTRASIAVVDVDRTLSELGQSGVSGGGHTLIDDGYSVQNLLVDLFTPDRRPQAVGRLIKSADSHQQARKDCKFKESEAKQAKDMFRTAEELVKQLGYDKNRLKADLERERLAHGKTSDQAEELKDELEEIQKHLASKTDALQEARRQLFGASANADPAHVMKGLSKSSASSSRQDLQSQGDTEVKRLMAQVQQLTTKNQALNRSLVDMTEQAQSSMRKGEKWLGQVNRIQAKLTAAEEERAGMLASLHASQESIQNLTVRIRAAEDERRKLEASIELQKDVARTQSYQLQAAEKDVEEKENALRKVRADLILRLNAGSSQAIRLNDAIREAEQLQEQVTNKTEQITQLETQLRNTTFVQQHLRDQIINKAREVKLLKEQLEADESKEIIIPQPSPELSLLEHVEAAKLKWLEAWNAKKVAEPVLGRLPMNVWHGVLTASLPNDESLMLDEITSTPRGSTRPPLAFADTVLCLCQTLRVEGLKLLLSKNEFILRPIFHPTKKQRETLQLTALPDFIGFWPEGRPQMLADMVKTCAIEISSAEMFHFVDGQDFMLKLQQRNDHRGEFFGLPRALPGIGNPFNHIRNLQIGLPINDTLPQDAVYFLNATLTLLKRYKELTEIDEITFDLEPFWRCAYLRHPNYNTPDTFTALKRVLKANPISAGRSFVTGGKEKSRQKMAKALRRAECKPSDWDTDERRYPDTYEEIEILQSVEEEPAT